MSASGLLRSDEIRTIRNYLHLNCAEYGTGKLFNPPQRALLLLTYSYSVTKPVNRHTVSDEIYLC